MGKYLIVLDLNDTILAKIKKSDKKTLSKLSKEQVGKLYRCTNYYLIERPNTKLFVDFLEDHKLDYIFWSTSMRHNLEKMLPFLCEIGYKKALGYLSQEDCEEGIITEKIKAEKSIKNLNKVCKVFKREIDDVILIDNSVEKHIKGQNFIQISDINLLEDNELLVLCKKLDKFIGCQKKCFIKISKENMQLI